MLVMRVFKQFFLGHVATNPSCAGVEGMNFCISMCAYILGAQKAVKKLFKEQDTGLLHWRCTLVEDGPPSRTCSMH